LFAASFEQLISARRSNGIALKTRSWFGLARPTLGIHSYLRFAAGAFSSNRSSPKNKIEEPKAGFGAADAPCMVAAAIFENLTACQGFGARVLWLK
jgi:hypothetical protein